MPIFIDGRTQQKTEIYIIFSTTIMSWFNYSNIFC